MQRGGIRLVTETGKTADARKRKAEDLRKLMASQSRRFTKAGDGFSDESQLGLRPGYKFRVATPRESRGKAMSWSHLLPGRLASSLWGAPATSLSGRPS